MDRLCIFLSARSKTGWTGRRMSTYVKPYGKALTWQDGPNPWCEVVRPKKAVNGTEQDLSVKEQVLILQHNTLPQPTTPFSSHLLPPPLPTPPSCGSHKHPLTPLHTPSTTLRPGNNLGNTTTTSSSPSTTTTK